MSYTRTYSASVTVSGSKTIKVPPNNLPSSHTVTYSETVPMEINITVETDPFDRSVNNAGLSVDGLTASVTAMSAANCAAIAANSEKISKSLINGFYNLINNDISVKRSESNSLLQSKTALLAEHSKAVRDKHERMLSDMERLSAHYRAIFRDLDADLEKRINDLDRPAFKLSEKIKNCTILKPFLSIGAATVSDMDTEQHTSDSITTARIRHSVSRVLEAMYDSLSKNLHYRKVMRNTLWNAPADNEEQFYIPVAYILSDGINGTGTTDNYYISSTTGAEQIINSVSSYVRSKGSSSEKAVPDDEFKFIDQAFLSMVEDSFLDHGNTDSYNKRVYSEILRLWQNSKSNIKQI